MRTDRACSQASGGTQGGKSYPRENSQVMLMVIVIFLPLGLFNHWWSHKQEWYNWESMITCATLCCHTVNISTSDFCRLIFLFFARDFFFSRSSIYGQTVDNQLSPFFDKHLDTQPNLSNSSMWLNSKWNTSIAPFRVDHQMDKAQSH